MFEVGTQVYKRSGYEFPGTVVSCFFTLDENERYVVESLRTPGMLHIFSPNQLVAAPMEAHCRCGHTWRDHETLMISHGKTVKLCSGEWGMGDLCGCANLVPEAIVKRQAEVWK